MAGLSVLLETHKNHLREPQIISKTTLLKPKNCSPTSSHSSTNSFLERCFLCRKELAEGKDIYMYRGDKAFCSVECRCRQIFMDEADSAGKRDHCANDASAVRSRRGRAPAGKGRAVAGGFAY